MTDAKTDEAEADAGDEAAEGGPFAVASERDRRKRMKAEGRWPSDEIPEGMLRAVTDIVGEQLRWMDAARLREALGGPPAPMIANPLKVQLGGHDFFAGPNEVENPAAAVYEALSRRDGSLHHNSIVELAIRACPKGKGDGQAALVRKINLAWREYGYAFQIHKIRADHYLSLPWRSDLLDTDMTDEAFRLLHRHGFAGPLLEFEDALRKLGRDDDAAAIEANNAFESVMKAIWTSLEPDAETDRVASVLLQNMERLQLLTHPDMRKVLQLLPTLRNQPGAGHGSGVQPKPVAPEVASLMVHLAGAAIVFLIRRYDEIVAARASKTTK